MKKVIGGIAALAFLLTLGSCGGPSEADMVGEWKIDSSSIDVKLGEGVPTEVKAMVQAGKADMLQEGSKEMEAASIKFEKGGKLIASAEGEEQEGKWKLDGDKLVVSMEEGGKEVSIAFNVDEVDGSKMTLTLTAEELLNTMKKQEPRAVDQIKAMTGTDVEKMIEGTSLTFSLKK